MMNISSIGERQRQREQGEEEKEKNHIKEMKRITSQLFMYIAWSCAALEH
jgi:hypothetical protein